MQINKPNYRTPSYRPILGYFEYSHLRIIIKTCHSFWELSSLKIMHRTRPFHLQAKKCKRCLYNYVKEVCIWNRTTVYETPTYGGVRGTLRSYLGTEPSSRLYAVFILFISFLALARKLFAIARRRIAMCLNLRWLIQNFLFCSIPFQRS